MRRLKLSELSDCADDFDASVVATEGIDHFCSSSDWVLPAANALMPTRESWVWQDDGCYWAFMRAAHNDGFHYLEPLEAMWALACPTVGRDSVRIVEGLVELCAMPPSDWTIMALSGLPAGHPLFVAIVSRLASRVQLGLGQNTKRLVVDLVDGPERFLARRSKHFRRSLRRSMDATRSAGITIEDGSGESPERLFARIMAVERRGWKGRDGVGIAEGSMHDFYREMMPRLCRHHSQRVLFASHEDQDVAYIFGGLCSGGYRGLQFSYDVAYRDYGLGNVLQFEQICRLCDEGAETYDLGMDMDYKRRWSDRERETVTLLLLRD